MKFGRMIYDQKVGFDNKSVFCNYGDIIQIEALDYLYRYMKIPEEKIVDINIYEMPNYDGEYLILPINCCLWTCDEEYFMPASRKIIPVFLGVHFRIPPTSKKSIEYLRKYAPIGCRDYSTYNMMESLGIPSYLNGCMTATLPKRMIQPSSGKVFMVDIPEKLEDYIPVDVRNKIEYISQIEYFSDDEKTKYKKTRIKTLDLYEKYQKEASLVVTSRLHCASPCMAMGIPVIITRNEMSCRFEWINKYLNVYCPSDFDKIEWNPEPIEYEDMKIKILSYNADKIRRTYEYYENMLGISEFYEGCDSLSALTIPEQFTDIIRKSGKKSFIIWGVGGYLGNAIYRIIERDCPEIEFAVAVDEYKDCVFHGKRTIRSNDLEMYPDSFVFVATASGLPMAERKLAELGYKKGQDYIDFGYLN